MGNGEGEGATLSLEGTGVVVGVSVGIGVLVAKGGAVTVGEDVDVAVGNRVGSRVPRLIVAVG